MRLPCFHRRALTRTSGSATSREKQAPFTSRETNLAITVPCSAIERCKRLVELTPRERVPLDWAMTQNNLGIALLRLGERESGTAKLEEAVAAFREALKEGPASGCRSTGP